MTQGSQPDEAASAALSMALNCGAAFEEQRNPQGAAHVLELLGQIKQGGRENGMLPFFFDPALRKLWLCAAQCRSSCLGCGF